MTQTNYDYQHVEGGVPIKMWTRGVPVDDKAKVGRGARPRALSRDRDQGDDSLE